MLNEQLQKQIEQEGEHYANVQIGKKAKFISHHDSRRWDDAKEDWEAGAGRYVSLWQAAEEKAARYEKALEKIRDLTPYSSLTGDQRSETMVEIATEALTPKTSDDDR